MQILFFSTAPDSLHDHYCVKKACECDHIYNEEDLYKRMQAGDTEILVCRVLIGDATFIKVLKRIRSKFSEFPILVLLHPQDSCIPYLDAGADAFLYEPTNVEEMRAKIDAIFRMCKSSY